MFRFHRRYALISLILFIVLAFIAIYVKDQFIRPFLGDVLVVFFVYYCVKTFLKASNFYIAIGVLLFAYSVEFAQYFKIVELLGLQDNKIATVIIGSTFDLMDLLAYTIGFIVILIFDGRKLPQ